MKPKAILRSFLLGCSSLLTTSSIHAAVFTWDAAATAGISSGTQNWSTTAPRWTTDGGATNVNWPGPGTDNDALVTLANNTLNVNSALDLDDFATTNPSGGNTIRGLSATVFTINLTGGTYDGTGTTGSQFSVASGGTLTLSATNGASTLTNPILAGTADLVKLGGGTLSTQWTTATFTGNVYVLGGILKIVDTGSLGDLTNDVYLNGGTLEAALTTADIILASGRNIFLGPATGSGSGTLKGGTFGFVAQGVIANNGGTGSLVWDSNGRTLTLSGANTYTGSTTVTGGGTLSISSVDNVANANPLGQSGAVAANLLLGTGTTLKYTGAAASTDRAFTINGTAAGNSATLDASGTGAINFTSTASPAYGTIDQTRTLILTGSNTGANILAANIANNGTGAVSLTKNGVGTWVLSGINSFTGPTTVSDGTLALSGGNNILLDTGAVNVNNAAGTLDISAVATSETIGSLAGVAGSNVVLGSRNLNAGSDNTTTTFAGVIGGTLGSLTKTGTGTLTLSGANAYTGGTAVTGGLLNANNASAVGTGTLNLQGGWVTFSTANTATVSNPINVTSAGTITVASRATTLSGLITISADTAFVGTGTDGSFVNQITQTGGITSANNSNITIAVNNAGNHHFSGPISLGTGSIARPSGSAALTLSNASNSFSGGLNLAASPSGSFTGLTTITNNGAQGSGNITFTGGTGGIVFSNTAGTVANNILSTGGSGGVTKTGASTMALTGANTYTGGTTVSVGTLLVNNTSGSGTGTGAVSVAGGATLGGTGTITPTVANGISIASSGKLAPGASDSIGALTIDLGSTIGGLAMASGSIFDWQLFGNGGTSDQLNFWNYNSGDLVLNSNAVNLKLTGAEAAGTYTATLFKFYSDGGANLVTSGWPSSGLSIGTVTGSFTGTQTFDYSVPGEIRLTYSVVPEPTSACVGLLIGAGLLRRRRTGASVEQ